MDTANYVQQVGKLINKATKYNTKLNRTDITNIVLIKHINDLLKFAMSKDDITEEQINKLKQYVLCLKKEISLYPEMLIENDCILTETEKHIIQE